MREYDEVVDEESAAATTDDGGAGAFERPRGGEGAGEDDVDPEEDDDWTASRARPLRAAELAPLLDRCTSREEGTDDRARCATIAAECCRGLATPPRGGGWVG
jgi:hypothetical protein